MRYLDLCSSLSGGLTMFQRRCALSNPVLPGVSSATAKLSKHVLVGDNRSATLFFVPVRNFAQAKKKIEKKNEKKNQRKGPQKPKMVYDRVKEAMGQRDRSVELLLAAMDAPWGQEPPLPQEEKDRRFHIGRTQVIEKFKRHNLLYHDLSCKINMKRHALDMLPRDSMIKEDALKLYQDGEKEPDFMNPPGPRLIPGLWDYCFPKEEKGDEVD